MQVKLTTTTKRENSTYIPTFSVTLQCRLKAPSSVMNPTLMFDRENVGNNYNYAYIPEFDRYYFVVNIVYAGALVEYDLRCDVLASFKATIGASTQYVLRAASEYDGDIVDMLYPTTTEPVCRMYTATNPWSAASLSQGTYSVGIISQNSIEYFLFTLTNFQIFFSYLLSDDYTNDVLGAFSITSPNLKMAVDPLQYISSVIWLPFDSGLEHKRIANGIKVGYTTVPAAYCFGVDLGNYQFSNVYHSDPIVFTQQAHPLAATRGDYLNSAQFTKCTIYVPPYGLIDLDPTVLNAAKGPVSVSIKTDMRTGDCVMTVSVIGNVNGVATAVREFTKLEFNNSIPVPISQIISQGMPNLLGGISTMLGGVLSGNPISMIGSALTGTMSMIESAGAAQVPEVRQNGKTSSIVNYSYNPYIQYVWQIPVDDDLSQRGRPLCKMKQISTLSGYILCTSDAEVQITGTSEEQQQIISYLAGGFYYE